MPEREAAWTAYDLFETSDGDMIFIGIVSDKQWEAFCHAFGLEDLLQNPAYGSERDRVRQRDEIHPRLRAALKRTSAKEALGNRACRR